MGSDRRWRVEEPRENLTPITKDFEKNLFLLQKGGEARQANVFEKRSSRARHIQAYYLVNRFLLLLLA